jgi:hypothetical protein
VIRKEAACVVFSDTFRSTAATTKLLFWMASQRMEIQIGGLEGLLSVIMVFKQNLRFNRLTKTDRSDATNTSKAGGRCRVAFIFK